MSQAQQYAWIKEHRPEVYARGQEGRRRRAVRPARRHVGGVRHQHAGPARRWPGSSCTASGSSSTSSASRTTRRGCPTPSASRRAAADHQAGRLQVAAHPEDLLDPDQQVPAPHLPLGGHRRHPDLHPLPADRHLQLLSGGEIAHAARNFKDKGVATALARADRLGRRRRRHHPRDGRQGAPAARTWRAAPGCVGSTRTSSSPKARGGVPERAGLGRRALPGAAPRHADQPGEDQAGQPAQRAPAARGRAVGGDGRRADRVRLPVRAVGPLWKTVLLHQFHDILPGSSIAWVHREAGQTYARRRRGAGGIIDARAARAGRRGRATGGRSTPRRTPATACRPARAAAVRPRRAAAHVTARRERRLRPRQRPAPVEIDGARSGRLRVRPAAGRETVAPGGPANLLQIHPDFPNMWDAWDVDAFYRNTVTDLTDADEVEPIIDRRRRRGWSSSASSRRLDGHPESDVWRRAPSGC